MINAFDINSYREILTVSRFDRAIGLLQEQESSTQNIRDLEENASGLKTACQEFEAIFINLLLQQFRQSIPDDGLIPKSFTLKTYEEMLDLQMSSDLSRNESFGIADALYRQLREIHNTYSEQDGEFQKGKILERNG